MIDLSALRAADYRNPSIRPWGRDYRTVGHDLVQITMPGTPRVWATHFLLGDLGPYNLLYSLLSLLGIAMGGAAGWVMTPVLPDDFHPVATLLLPLAGAVIGWALLGRVVMRMLSTRVHTRLGRAHDSFLVLTIRGASGMPPSERSLVELLDAAGDRFLAGEANDASFLNATAHTIDALADRGDTLKLETAKLHLEEVLTGQSRA